MYSINESEPRFEGHYKAGGPYVAEVKQIGEKATHIVSALYIALLHKRKKVNLGQVLKTFPSLSACRSC